MTALSLASGAVGLTIGTIVKPQQIQFSGRGRLQDRRAKVFLQKSLVVGRFLTATHKVPNQQQCVPASVCQMGPGSGTQIAN
jgi:hypothetical protein